MRTCLVLEGGAMRGMYTAGVLDVLLKNNIQVDCVIGVSAGALFGVNYVSKQIGRSYRYVLKYLNNPNFMSVSSLIRTGNIMNKEFNFNKLINELDKFDFDTFDNSKTKFYSVVTNIETGKAEYIEIKDSRKDMEYLRASGSMPLVSKKIKINNNFYLDGAIGDSIPVKKAEELGYDKIIVVTTRTIDYRKKESKMFLLNKVYRKYPNFINAYKNRYLNYNDTVEYIISQENKGNILVIRPSKDLKVKRLEKNKDKINDLYNLGIEDTENKLKDIKRYLKSRKFTKIIKQLKKY